MTISYLPFEIWENIHSYLAPNVVINMIGVNRYFFEAAMNEIYCQICISNAEDEGQIKRLQQLQNPSNAARVKHIKMAPYFLPQSDNDGKPLPQRTSSEFGYPVFLKKTMRVLFNCKNLQTLTICLHYSRAVTTPFHNFISNLVSKAGSQLQKLSVNMTVMHFRLLDAFLAAKSWSPRIKVMDLTILPSYGVNESKQVTNNKPPVEVVGGFQKHFSRLLSSTRPCLESLHINNYDVFDFLAIFSDLIGFSLKEFLYQGHGRAHDFFDLQTLNGLLATSSSLKHFSFTALSRCLWHTTPPVGYYEDENWPAAFNKNAFEFRLAGPSSLFIRLPEDLSSFHYLDTLSSDFAIFGPGVNHVAIKSLQGLTYTQFRQISDWIARVYKKQDRKDGLQAIEFDRLDIFSPVHLNEMMKQMPSLTNVTIGFERLSVDPMIRKKRHSQSRMDFENEVFADFRTFEYATSGLGCLRLVRGSKSGGMGGRDVQPQLLENLGIALPSVRVIKASHI